MSRKKRPVSAKRAASAFAALLLTAPGLGAFTPCRAEKVKAWRILQHNKLVGQRDVYIAPGYLRASNNKTGQTLVSTAPKWEVLLLNTKTRRYFSTPFENWQGRVPANFEETVRGLGSKPQAVNKIRQVAGMRTQLYVMRRKQIDDEKFIADSFSSLFSQYWLAIDIPMAPGLSKIVGVYYALPELPYFPLTATYHKGKEGISNDLLTASCTKVEVDKSVFAIPPDYKKAKAEFEIMAGAAGDDLLEFLR
ncbi:MAG TPA: hypothetical protein V6D17_06435 [Candidatus Obscuribacterales bacterium]